MFPTPHGSGQDVFIFNGTKTLHSRRFPVPPYSAAELATPWPEAKFSMKERDDLTGAWAQIEALAATIDPEEPWNSQGAGKLDLYTIREWVEHNVNTSMGAWWMGAMSRMGGSGSFDLDASMLHLGWTQRVAPQREVSSRVWLGVIFGGQPLLSVVQIHRQPLDCNHNR